eukprot:Colp12_sorted_trinity150504_noHs@3262
MESMFGTATRGARQVNWAALKNMTNLTPAVQEHLKNVYATLAISMLTSSIAAYLAMTNYWLSGGFLSSLGAFGFMMALAFSRGQGPDQQGKRFMYLQGFAACQGLGLGPLLGSVADIDPRIITTAFLGTMTIFLCFTGAALLSQRRSFIFLGGWLSSGLSLMFLMSFINMFMWSVSIFSAQLYLGLMIMATFILYDTQLIVEKCSRGDKDFIWHAVDLFVDFVGVFVRLLIILTKDKKEDKKRRN